MWRYGYESAGQKVAILRILSYIREHLYHSPKCISKITRTSCSRQIVSSLYQNLTIPWYDTRHQHQVREPNPPAQRNTPRLAFHTWNKVGSDEVYHDSSCVHVAKTYLFSYRYPHGSTCRCLPIVTLHFFCLNSGEYRYALAWRIDEMAILTSHGRSRMERDEGWISGYGVVEWFRGMRGDGGEGRGTHL